MRFSEDFLREIKARVRLSDVIGKSMPLKRQGREFAGLSPFNKEKSASFFVNDQKGFYHCFSSGKHGDAIDFMMEVERLTFPEAVARLAADAGVPLPEETSALDPEKKSRFESMLKAIDDAARFFEAELRRVRGTDGRNYLAKRGLPEEAWSQFRLGWAPQTRTALRDHLLQSGHPRDILLEAGLLIAPEGGGEPYDRFRGRIMFPICDPRGRLVAFGGRTLDPNERAKYLNSPETPLFEKGRLLYRFPEARKAAGGASANPRVVIAEGYMDVIALERSGIPAVAPLGTALTEDQLALLWRIAPEPVLCFDGDAAGQRAAFRSIDRALPKIGVGRTLRFAALPDKLDPDDLIRDRGRDAMIAVLENASPLFDVLWQREFSREKLDTAERRAGFRARLLSAVELVEDIGVKSALKQDVYNKFREYSDAVWSSRKERRPEKPQKHAAGPTRGLKIKTAMDKVRPPTKRIMQEIVIEAVGRPIRVADECELLGQWLIHDPDLDTLRHALLDAFNAGDPIDALSLRCHLLEDGETGAAALLERFSGVADGEDLHPPRSDEDDKKWKRALSQAVQSSELERDVSESRAMLAIGAGAALHRHSRIAAERRGEAEQDLHVDRSKGQLDQQENDPGEADASNVDDGDIRDDFDDYGFREIELGDEGEK